MTRIISLFQVSGVHIGSFILTLLLYLFCTKFVSSFIFIYIILDLSILVL